MREDYCIGRNLTCLRSLFDHSRQQHSPAAVSCYWTSELIARDISFASTDYAWTETEDERKKRLASKNLAASETSASAPDIDAVFQLS